MLRCPKCKFTYNDETQIFCTNDGARLLNFDQAPEETPKNDLSRRTPIGELLFEIYISPPGALASKETASPKAKPSYQMFGLHSSSGANARQDAKAANGFHSFDYLVVRDDETKAGLAQFAPKTRETSRDKMTDDVVVKGKQKFGTPFILICLLSALIFLTCLMFIVNYFLKEQHQSSTLPSAATKVTRERGAVADLRAAKNFFDSSS